LEGLDGLVIPGGESTTMLRILRDEDLFEPLIRFGQRRPVFGTCAGAILLATEVCHPAQESLGLIEMSVQRNSYGRQLESCVLRLLPEAEFVRQAGSGELEAVFIRAPKIRRVAPDARVYLYRNGDPVLVAQGRHLVATFHPELTSDPRIHRLFVEGL
jgi:5'-phosphate synthase pdxT subunit